MCGQLAPAQAENLELLVQFYVSDYWDLASTNIYILASLAKH